MVRTLTEGVAVPYVFNIRRGQYPGWASAVADMLAGTSNAVLSAEGDSTVRGTGSTGDATQHANGWPEKLKALLADFTPDGENFFGTGGGFHLSSMISTYDNRVASSGGFSSRTTLNSMGGYLPQCEATGTLSFTPRSAFDTIEVYYAQAGSLGQFSVDVDGGSALQTVNAGANPGQVMKATISCDLDTHTVNLNWVSGTVYIFGVNCFDSSTSKKLLIYNQGRHGSSTVDWVSGSTSTWGPLDSFPRYGIDLSIICLGINDWRTSVGAATFKTRMQTLITTQVNAGCKPMLMTPVFDNGSAGETAQQEDYVTALRELAVSNDLALIDIRAKWGSYAAADAAGLYEDDVHPSGTGYQDIAETVAAAVTYVS
jgi:lysophospholipase L1-like esterase